MNREQTIAVAFKMRREFMEATKGHGALKVALAIHRLWVTPGVDWTGSSRGDMAESFAMGQHGLHKLNLDELRGLLK